MLPSSLAHASSTDCASSRVSSSARTLPSLSSTKRTAISKSLPRRQHLSPHGFRRRAPVPLQPPTSGARTVSTGDLFLAIPSSAVKEDEHEIEEDDRPPICPACGVTMGIREDRTSIRFLCL